MEEKKCVNYEICETYLPEWWEDCKGKWLCTNCDILFGTWGEENKGRGELEFYNNIECIICNDKGRGISYPSCNHIICKGCFKRVFYGDENEKDRPKFPYPEIEDEYFNEEYPERNPKWKEYIKEIERWNEEDIKWEERWADKYEKEKYLRKCCICRK